MSSWFFFVDYIYNTIYIHHIVIHGFMASNFVSQDSIGCLIIDEVHERDVANPVLLSVLLTLWQKKTEIRS